MFLIRLKINFLISYEMFRKYSGNIERNDPVIPLKEYYGKTLTMKYFSNNYFIFHVRLKYHISILEETFVKHLWNIPRIDKAIQCGNVSKRPFMKHFTNIDIKIPHEIEESFLIILYLILKIKVHDIFH